MINNPITAVWEITMGCNMRCKHCGSSCEGALLGELSTKEALDLCDQIGDLGFQWITLSGGEPTTRKDWNQIARRLKDNGVIPNMISNGWLLNEDLLNQAVEAGINTIAISVDGLEDTHDYIRKKGSYQRIVEGFQRMKKKGIHAAAITTINSMNIGQLPALKKMLVENGVEKWQIQLGLPMGNMAQNNELVSKPYHIDDVIQFICEASVDQTISIDPADCIGYYNKNLAHALKTIDTNGNEHLYTWNGCGAGKTSLGILHNGDILGCTSIRNKSFIEGSIRNTPLKDIWYNPQGFSWNRQLTKEALKGFCNKCQFGTSCLGGCSNTRITMEGDLLGENKYCSYHLAVSKAHNVLEQVTNIPTLFEKATLFLESNNFQLAEIVLHLILEKEPDNLEALSLYGYVSFMLDNFINSKNANEKILQKKPQDPYAHKGLGLSLCKLGDLEQGISLLRKSIALSPENFMDPYYDLSLILMEQNRKEEALEILTEGRKKSPFFVKQSEPLWTQLAH